MLDKILIMAKGMNRRFPDGNSPYEIMTRLLEECGEVAAEVNDAIETSIHRLISEGHI